MLYYYLAVWSLLFLTLVVYKPFAVPLLIIWIPGLVPYFAIIFRRLHDVGRGGEWLLIVLIPWIGFFLLLRWLAEKGHTEPNEYGPSPETS